MVRIVELKENLLNSSVIDNIYNIKNLSENIIEELELQREINKDDYNYLEIILEKIRRNLEKAYIILKA